ncbi:hypothetical protein FRC0129_02092 [Corynebacterium diphtheriae]|nr:hypothetical protein FRC0129_02092 [Corynebacterium diphtheriae]
MHVQALVGAGVTEEHDAEGHDGDGARMEVIRPTTDIQVQRSSFGRFLPLSNAMIEMMMPIGPSSSGGTTRSKDTSAMMPITRAQTAMVASVSVVYL